MEAAPAPMAEAVIALPSAPLSSLPAPAPRKLRDRVIEALRVRHYSLATEADAIATDPGAERVLGSLERRQVPESVAEAVGLKARDGARRPG